MNKEKFIEEWIEQIDEFKIPKGNDSPLCKKLMIADLETLIQSAVDEALQEFVNDNKTADDHFTDGYKKGKEEQKEKDITKVRLTIDEARLDNEIVNSEKRHKRYKMIGGMLDRIEDRILEAIKEQ